MILSYIQSYYKAESGTINDMVDNNNDYFNSNNNISTPSTPSPLGVLFYCISPTQRHARCMDIALTYGSDVNCQTTDGVPVFLKSCETASENEDMCMNLLKKGANPNSKHEVSLVLV